MADNSYKTCTDEIRKLYLSFLESGFDRNQAFELTAVYVRQSMFDNILREQRESSRRDAMARYMQRKKEHSPLAHPERYVEDSIAIYNDMTTAQRKELLKHIESVSDETKKEEKVPSGYNGQVFACCECGRINVNHPQLKFIVAPYNDHRAGGYICDDCYRKVDQEA